MLVVVLFFILNTEVRVLFMLLFEILKCFHTLWRVEHGFVRVEDHTAVGLVAHVVGNLLLALRSLESLLR